MSISKIWNSVVKVFVNSAKIIRDGSKTIQKNPQIMAYPYLAVAVILVTFPTVNTLAFWLWNAINYDFIHSATDDAPQALRIVLGLATFSLIYTTFIMAFFTCAVSAGVLAALKEERLSIIQNLKAVGRRFLRVSHFAILAVFFFPIGIYVQRHKLPKGIFSVVGSSWSLSMSHLAPAVLTNEKSVSDTIRDSIDTLGELWKESLLIKVYMYLGIILVGLLGFLPKLAESYWFDSDTAQIVGWLASVLLWLVGYVLVKVIGNVFISVLYFKAKNSKL